MNPQHTSKNDEYKRSIEMQGHEKKPDHQDAATSPQLSRAPYFPPSVPLVRNPLHVSTSQDGVAIADYSQHRLTQANAHIAAITHNAGNVGPPGHDRRVETQAKFSSRDEPILFAHNDDTTHTGATPKKYDVQQSTESRIQHLQEVSRKSDDAGRYAEKLLAGYRGERDDEYNQVAKTYVAHGVEEVPGQGHAERKINAFERERGRGATNDTTAGMRTRCNSCAIHEGAQEMIVGGLHPNLIGTARHGLAFPGTEGVTLASDTLRGRSLLAPSTQTTAAGFNRARSNSPRPSFKLGN